MATQIWRGLAGSIATLGLLAVMPAAALAEGVVQRAARTGELVMSGLADVPPLVVVGPQGQPSGYGILVADRIAAEVARAVGRPVTVRFAPVANPRSLVDTITNGKADLACGFPFSWELDMQVDFSLPIGISGLRLLAPAGRFDGSPAALAGRRIAVVRQSLGETELRGMQPKATVVAFDNLSAAVAALRAGTVEGVVGDTVVLAGLVHQQGLKGLALTPDLPFEAYAVSCVLAENDSAFRNLANLAIARLLQGYLDGEPDTVAAVNRWLGPTSAVAMPESALLASFEAILLGVETIRLIPAAAR
ncbi:extracellular substrate binding-like orphan protein GrrP [Cyanobium sp. Alchichica 3B3-8F6]|uniref:extracellular substrate binding-like orphan protein GrrP n=1 Tax=Cyanobium sp. Alchichica 3B3-8F6 TaxID=2823696 RepID=UPI0020CE1A7E|nr:extracellular substrate binding-like orphan protein GrrP [Cyanobium sp. Alchichica 3B3-8F6]